MSNKKKQYENRHISRRQFLAGTGSFLVLPPLLSLMPTEVMAQVTASTRRRSVTLFGLNGVDNHQLFPANPTGLTQQAGLSVFTKQLSSFSSPISRMVDSDFVSMYPHMNLIQGLSMTGGNYAGHNIGVLSGVHGGEREPGKGSSICNIMEKSTNVYKSTDNVPVKAVRLFTSEHDSVFNHYHQNGSIVTNSGIQGDKNLFNTLFQNFTGGTSTVSDDKLIIDKVYADLKALESNTRMSKEDKVVLERYVNSVYEVQVKINSVNQGAACVKPTVSFQASKAGNYWWLPDDGWGITDCGAMYDNYNELIKIAFACDLTRVVTMGCTLWTNQPINRDANGGIHHEAGSSEIAADRQKWGLKCLLRLAKLLQATPDPYDSGKTILDNSILLWTNELGDWTTGHNVLSMPVITFGKGGGFFKTGYFVDYRQKPLPDYYHGNPGRPYKQVLQSIMASMGIPKSEYMQYGDGQGFGDFNPTINQFGAVYKDIYAAYKNEHNDVLPFLCA